MQKQQAFLPQPKSKKPHKKLTTETILGIPYYVVLIGLIVIPIFMMVLYSFQREGSSIFVISFTFEHYMRFLSERQFISLTIESLYLAGIATFVTLLIGYPMAYLISRSKPRTQLLLILLINAPMWINMLLRTRALQQVIEMIAPDMLGSNLVIVIGMTYIFLPFMILPIYAVLSKIDPSYFESAADLGANKFQTITKVIIPLSLSGILSGIMMVFLPAATTLVIPKYLGNNRYLIGNLIENAMIQQGRFGYGSAIAIVLSVIIMGFVYFIKKVDRFQGVNINEEV